jgi:hypothetical protein
MSRDEWRLVVPVHVAESRAEAIEAAHQAYEQAATGSRR